MSENREFYTKARFFPDEIVNFEQIKYDLYNIVVLHPTLFPYLCIVKGNVIRRLKLNETNSTQ